MTISPGRFLDSSLVTSCTENPGPGREEVNGQDFKVLSSPGFVHSDGKHTRAQQRLSGPSRSFRDVFQLHPPPRLLCTGTPGWGSADPPAASAWRLVVSALAELPILPAAPGVQTLASSSVRRSECAGPSLGLPRSAPARHHDVPRQPRGGPGLALWSLASRFQQQPPFPALSLAVTDSPRPQSLRCALSFCSIRLAILRVKVCPLREQKGLLSCCDPDR